jgi:hypothetical protein
MGFLPGKRTHQWSGVQPLHPSSTREPAFICCGDKGAGCREKRRGPGSIRMATCYLNADTEINGVSPTARNTLALQPDRSGFSTLGPGCHLMANGCPKLALSFRFHRKGPKKALFITERVNQSDREWLAERRAAIPLPATRCPATQYAPSYSTGS